MSYERACALADVPDDRALAVTLGAYDVAIARDGDEVHAVQDLCSHASVELSDGDVEGGQIECWLHGSCFDLRSGKPTGLPATESVAVFAAEVRGDDVFVDTATTTNGVTPS